LAAPLAKDKEELPLSVTDPVKGGGLPLLRCELWNEGVMTRLGCGALRQRMAHTQNKEDARNQKASLLSAITTNSSAITQDPWRIPAEEVCSFQAAILQEHLHRFFRGRDSMREQEQSPFYFLAATRHFPPI
jgi:hypothetical protein